MVLREQSQELLLDEVGQSLLRLGKLYQVPGFDDVAAFLLAEWVIDEFKHYDLDLVRQALKNPPVSKDPSWRITPDTITGWVRSKEQERETKKAKIESERRQSKKQEVIPISEETAKSVDDLLKRLSNEITQTKRESVSREIKKIIHEDRIREGKSYSAGYIPPSAEYVVMAQLRSEYGRLYTDPHTGKRKEGSPSFEEFMKQNI